MNLIWAPAQLAMLAKVVDLNGFSAAARALGVPKAAVSRAVADLERCLGVKVLERTTRRIALTNAGRLVYPHARRVLDETDAAHAAARGRCGLAASARCAARAAVRDTCLPAAARRARAPRRAARARAADTG